MTGVCKCKGKLVKDILVKKSDHLESIIERKTWIWVHWQLSTPEPQSFGSQVPAVMEVQPFGRACLVNLDGSGKAWRLFGIEGREVWFGLIQLGFGPGAGSCGYTHPDPWRLGSRLWPKPNEEDGWHGCCWKAQWSIEARGVRRWSPTQLNGMLKRPRFSLEIRELKKGRCHEDWGWADDVCGDSPQMAVCPGIWKWWSGSVIVRRCSCWI